MTVARNTSWSELAEQSVVPENSQRRRVYSDLECDAKPELTWSSAVDLSLMMTRERCDFLYFADVQAGDRKHDGV